MRVVEVLRRTATVVVMAALAVCVASPASRSGTFGKLSGVVLDAKKQPLPGANVVIPEVRLGAATDANGRYVVFNVPAGTYTVKVSLIGFATTTLTGVAI